MRNNLKKYAGWFVTFWTILATALEKLSPDGWEKAFGGMMDEGDHDIGNRYERIASLIVFGHPGIQGKQMHGLKRTVVSHGLAYWGDHRRCIKALVWLLEKSDSLRTEVMVSFPQDPAHAASMAELENMFGRLNVALASCREMLEKDVWFIVLEGSYLPAEERVVPDDAGHITIHLSTRYCAPVRDAKWHLMNEQDVADIDAIGLRGFVE